MELTENQLVIVENKLTSLGITYEPLMEDLIDHVCCQIEQEISSTSCSFEHALENALEAYGTNGVQQLQSETLLLIHQKYIAMKKIALITTLCLFVGFSIVWAQTQDLQFTSPMGSSEIKIASAFGLRHHPILGTKKLHKGVDYKADLGTPVLSVEDGLVFEIKEHEKGYGKHIVIQHDSTYTSMYAHLSEFCVEKGQRIKKGTLIGKVGSTGASVSPHLHLEIRENGVAIDPKTVLKP